MLARFDEEAVDVTPTLTSADMEALLEIRVKRKVQHPALLDYLATDESHAANLESLSLIIDEISHYQSLDPINSLYYKAMCDNEDDDFISCIHRVLADNKPALKHYIDKFHLACEQFYTSSFLLLSKNELLAAVGKLESALEFLPILLNMLQINFAETNRSKLIAIFTLCTAILNEAKTIENRLDLSVNETIFFNKKYLKFTEKLIEVMSKLGIDPKLVQADMHLGYLKNHLEELNERLNPLAVMVIPTKTNPATVSEKAVDSSSVPQQNRKKHQLSIRLDAPLQPKSILSKITTRTSMEISAVAAAHMPKSQPTFSWLAEKQQKDYFNTVVSFSLLNQLQVPQAISTPLPDIQIKSSQISIAHATANKTYFSPMFLNLHSNLSSSDSDSSDDTDESKLFSSAAAR